MYHFESRFPHPIDFKLCISPSGKFENLVKGLLSVDSGFVFNASKQCKFKMMLDPRAVLAHMKMVRMEHGA